MQVALTKTPGLRNDLLITIPRDEIDDARLHIANRDRLMELPGLLRHVEQDPEQRRAVGDCKVPVEDHLRALSRRGPRLFGESGRPARRVLAIGARSVGNNHGVVAWQREERPKLFHVAGDPMTFPSYSCLIRQADGHLGIRRLRFAGESVLDGDTDASDSVAWCVFGNQVLRDGRIVPVEETIAEYSDIRHVLAFDRNTVEGGRIEARIYAGYPQRFRQNALEALLDGVPRQRFLHNAIGLADDHVCILQREGTPEEVGVWLRDAGCRDGLILDNGGSVFCWAWWPYPNGGFVFTAPDYRPNASAILAFVLTGGPFIDLPCGSVGYTVL